jgi:two-component system NtrC family sensor kinase
MNAVIDEALNLDYHGAHAQDQSFNITLERDFGQDIAPIEVNPQDMTRVFLNIFSNGFYAATRRGRNVGDAALVSMLKVTTRDIGETVEIRVRGNGTGVPAEIRDKLFQPFFTTKRTGEGTGHGLSITCDIVTKQHGGTITVDGEVDAFTEFVVTLPSRMFANAGHRACKISLWSLASGPWLGWPCETDQDPRGPGLPTTLASFRRYVCAAKAEGRTLRTPVS